MPAKHEFKILHLGKILFPLPPEDWYRRIATMTGQPILLTTQAELSGGIPLLKNFDLVRVGREWAHEVYSLFQACPPLMVQEEYVDLIYKMRNKKSSALWPALLHKEALQSAILLRQPSLNLKGAGLIIGLTSESVIAAHVLVELGLRQITFVVENEEAAKAKINLLRNSLFEVKFEAINRDKVILLPGVFSAVLNYVDLHHQPELLTALLYFNYLERDGIFFNLLENLDKIPLLEEAAAIGAKILDVKAFQMIEAIAAIKKVIPISHRQVLDLLKPEIK